MVEFRSDFEREIGEQISWWYKVGIEEYYEKIKLQFSNEKEPTQTRYYYPDFILPNGIVIEAKGYFRQAVFERENRLGNALPVCHGGANTAHFKCQRV
jgi:hypothetical protein